MAQTTIDVAIRTKGENELEKLQSRMLQLERQVAQLQGGLPKAANSMRGFGAASQAAAGGVRTIGTAIQAALGPIAAVTGAIGALTSAFQTIAAQDFAEAKVRTLGTNSQELVAQLKIVSGELKGQASVAELTAAAYDVASAGFVKAADAAMVLKAASLGATGGFSDINTVGNAATSVLNAYGLSAADAALVVDRFIQTQNDGKIVVAEYAQNIGKVAAAAAGLQIPLEEVNAVIAQATASGVQAEVAFTGLKSAFARLASGDANKELEGFGITIDAASIASDGLYGTLKKLEGLDTGTLFKVLGTEAGPALLPVIQNLERFEELIKKQEGSAGAAAKANDEATNTIQGAWKAVQKELSNLFSDQAALGTLIKGTLQFAALAVKNLARTLNILLAPLKAVIDQVSKIASALDQAFDITGTMDRASSAVDGFGADLVKIREELINDLAKAFDPVVDLWGQAMDAISGWWGDTTQTMGQMADGLGSWIQGVWNGIASGAQGIIAPITNAFSAAFNAAWGIIQNFWNGLPGWLRGALSTAGSVIGGVTSAVTGALNKVGAAVQKGIAAAGKAGAGKTGPSKINYTSPAAGAAAPLGGGDGGGGKGGKGGKGSKGKKERESQVPQLQAELALQQKLYALEQQLNAAKLADDKVAQDAIERKIVEAELDGKIAKLQLEKIPAAEKGLKVEMARLEASSKLAELDFKAAKAEGDRQKTLKDLLTGFDREIELAGAKTEEAKKLLEIEHKILDLKDQGVLKTEAEVQAYRARAQAAAAAGGGKGKLQQYMSDLQTQLNDTEGMIVSLAQTVEGEIGSAMSNAITGLIEGTTTAEQALSDMFKNIGKAFIDMATQMIAKALIMKALGILGGAAGGGGGGGFGSSWGGFGGALAMPSLMADGGFVTGPTPAVVGEGGSDEYIIPEAKMGSAMARWNAGARGDAVINGADPSGGSGGPGGATADQPPQINISGGIMQFNDTNYIRQDQIPAIVNQASKAGEARALRRLQMSPGTRRRVGV